MWVKFFKKQYRLSLLLIAFAVLSTTAFSSPLVGGEGSAYVYPIVPGTDAWRQLETHDDMLLVTQIPADTLRKLSTKSLVETVLNYPLYGDIFAYNSLQQGFDSVANTFNGLQELWQRKDAARKLMSLYANMSPLEIETNWTLEQQGDYDRQFTYVEVLLAQDEILNQLSPEQQLELLELAWAKIQAKRDMAEIYGLQGLETSLLLSGRILAASQPNTFDPAAKDIQSFLRGGSTDSVAVLNAVIWETAKVLGKEPFSIAVEGPGIQDYNTYVYTPKGSAVPVIYRTYELSASQIAANDAWVRSNYPNATLLRSSSRKYNCHSYAWHSQSTSNSYWMNTPGDDKYWQDGSYYLLYYCPANNAKASYASDDHSAHIDSSGNLQSKWGQLGLVRHTTCYCPYNCSTINFYKRS